MAIEPRQMRGDHPLDNRHACEIANAICERLDKLIELGERIAYPPPVQEAKLAESPIPEGQDKSTRGKRSRL